MTSAKRGDHLAFVRTELPRSGPQESYRNRGTAKAKRGGSLIRPVSCPFAADEPLDVMFNPDPRALRAHARRIVAETVYGTYGVSMRADEFIGNAIEATKQLRRLRQRAYCGTPTQATYF